EPPPSAAPPLKIKVEHSDEPGDLTVLKKDIEKSIREKLIFSSSVELVPPGTLPKFEYKAKLVEHAYEK
ncbi:MAG TPA: phenylacetate--CoA ligase family protein, partial [Desulfobacteria bacterium]|nr:phenylacetate--CoA ligase family protein [Desulfobacteria bacterium]